MGKHTIIERTQEELEKLDASIKDKAEELHELFGSAGGPIVIMGATPTGQPDNVYGTVLICGSHKNLINMLCTAMQNEPEVKKLLQEAMYSLMKSEGSNGPLKNPMDDPNVN